MYECKTRHRINLKTKYMKQLSVFAFIENLLHLMTLKKAMDVVDLKYFLLW